MIRGFGKADLMPEVITKKILIQHLLVSFILLLRINYRSARRMESFSSRQRLHLAAPGQKMAKMLHLICVSLPLLLASQKAFNNWLYSWPHLTGSWITGSFSYLDHFSKSQIT